MSTSTDRNVLITGGAGFIGLHLANRLAASGYSVCIADNFSRGMHDKHLQRFLDHSESSCTAIDLLDETKVLDLGDHFHFIFHLAAIVGVMNVSSQPYSVLTQNVELLRNVVRLSAQQKNLHRLLFASTSEVYAGTLKHFDLPIPTPEQVPIGLTSLSAPRTTYMLSKLFGEAMCLQSGLPVTIFRPHNIYGPRMGMAHVIPEQLNKIYRTKSGQQISVASVDHTRAFCYVTDAVVMLEEMMKAEACAGKILNLGCEHPEISIQDLVGICLEVTEADRRIVPLPPTTGSPVRRAPDMTLTHSCLRARPKVGLHEGIRHTWDWYLAHDFGGLEEHTDT